MAMEVLKSWRSSWDFSGMGALRRRDFEASGVTWTIGGMTSAYGTVYIHLVDIGLNPIEFDFKVNSKSLTHTSFIPS